jgi:hypothetical protein
MPQVNHRVQPGTEKVVSRHAHFSQVFNASILISLDSTRKIPSRLMEHALYRTDPRAANALSARLVGIDGELTALLERWEDLER